MKATTDSTWTFQMIIIFMLIFSTFLALILIYSKAFSIKNHMVTTIEKYEGITSESASIIVNFAKNKSYTESSTCPTDGDWYGLNLDGTYSHVTEGEKYNFCFREKNVLKGHNNYHYYEVQVFYRFRLFFLNNIGLYRIKGETKKFIGNDSRAGGTGASNIYNADLTKSAYNNNFDIVTATQAKEETTPVVETSTSNETVVTPVSVLTETQQVETPAETQQPTETNEPEKEFKYYNQCSASFKSINGYDTCNCGCGYVALAMIVDSINGTDLTPKGLIRDMTPKQFTYKNCAVYDETLTSNAITILYGITPSVLLSRDNFASGSSVNSRKKAIVDALRDGYKIELLVPGHFIALGGINGDKISVYDSASSSNTKEYTIDELYNHYYNHKNRCTKGTACGFVYAVQYK